MKQHTQDETTDYHKLKEAYLRYENDRSSEAEAKLIEAENNIIARHGKVKYRSWYDRIRSLVYSV